MDTLRSLYPLLYRKLYRGTNLVDPMRFVRVHIGTFGLFSRYLSDNWKHLNKLVRPLHLLPCQMLLLSPDLNVFLRQLSNPLLRQLFQSCVTYPGKSPDVWNNRTTLPLSDRRQLAGWRHRGHRRSRLGAPTFCLDPGRLFIFSNSGLSKREKYLVSSVKCGEIPRAGKPGFANSCYIHTVRL